MDIAVGPSGGVASYNRILVICSLIAWGGFQYGFDNSAIAGLQAMPGFLMVFGYSAPELPLGWNISPKVQQLISSFMILGAFIGAVASGPLGHYFGRKVGIWAAVLTSYLSISIMIGTTNLGALYFARIVIGVSNGLFIAFCVLYLTETSPGHLRGAVVSAFQMYLVVGQIIGSVVDNYTQVRFDRLSYQIPLIVLYAIPVAFTLLVLWIPDTPRWLLQKDRVEDAKAALYKLHGQSTAQTVISEQLADIQAAIKAEEAQGGIEFLDLFRGTDLRRTFLSVATGLFQAGSGVLFISIFATFFFVLGGVDNPFQATIILLCCGFVGNVTCIVISRYIGRRPLLIAGPLLSGLCLIGIGIAFTVDPTSTSAGKALIGLSCVYLWSYNTTTGPLCYVVSAEIPSQRLRSWTLGLGMAVGFTFGWLCIFTSPYFINPAGSSYIGLKTCYIWGASNVLMSIFAAFFIPETKDRSLEEIDEMFMVGLPAWQFTGYVCTGVGAHHTAGNIERSGTPRSNEKQLQVESNHSVTPTGA